MKLFVWEDVLCDYTCGMIICVAEDLESAKQAFRNEMDNLFGMEIAKYYLEVNSEPIVYDLTVPCNPICHYVTGGG